MKYWLYAIVPTPSKHTTGRCSIISSVLRFFLRAYTICKKIKSSICRLMHRSALQSRKWRLIGMS